MPSKNTGPLLQRLRSLMQNKKFVPEVLHAYIVPTDDAHQSEYIADCDKRRAFISGFTGSAGTAIITSEHAALWTDGRYFLQAQAQLDAHWTLMKSGLPDTPAQADWLKNILPENGRVGVDPFLLSASSWQPLQRELASDGHALVAVSKNLIDSCWEDRPEPPANSVFVHPEIYAGQSWWAKIKNVRDKMKEKGATSLVVTALDEIAWLLNLRGSDIDFNPVFFGYVIVTMDDVLFFVDESKLGSSVKTHLQEDSCRVTILPYGTIKEHLDDIVKKASGKTWVSDKSSQALYSAVPQRLRLSHHSPVAVMKAVKNATEIQGMRNAHIKDGVALCQYLHWLENEIPKGSTTEVSGADRLEMFRREQQDFMSLSFETISGFGSNGAVIHYKPCEETDKLITNKELYLVDSGAQFRDGTTDVTRTVHFGSPTRHEQECFTRVLKGHIALASVVFPNGVKGNMLDSFARMSLWEAGLDYLHGTGHGVGAFLNVHEGPCSVSFRARPDEVALAEGMIISDEPGYYEDGKFGIRIESLVLVVKKETQHNFREKGFIGFEPITLTPIQTKMIVPELLTEKEEQWLNDYHAQCRDVLGPVMLEQGHKDVYNWLLRETAPIG